MRGAENTRFPRGKTGGFPVVFLHENGGAQACGRCRAAGVGMRIFGKMKGQGA